MTLANHQPFYCYLDDDSVKRLAVRVTLRKVASLSVDRISSRSIDPASAIVQTIGWQEKVPGPRDIINRLRNAKFDELSEAERDGKAMFSTSKKPSLNNQAERQDDV